MYSLVFKCYGKCNTIFDNVIRKIYIGECVPINQVIKMVGDPLHVPKCPNCKTARDVVWNEKGQFRCRKCGWKLE
jgi:tRNA(Ile2) C34 agmatinyltransferase TiaS